MAGSLVFWAVTVALTLGIGGLLVRALMIRTGAAGEHAASDIGVYKDQLREMRGENAVYHNNCIQTWYVNAQGVAENVEVS